MGGSHVLIYKDDGEAKFIGSKEPFTVVTDHPSLQQQMADVVADFNGKITGYPNLKLPLLPYPPSCVRWIKLGKSSRSILHQFTKSFGFVKNSSSKKV